MRRKCVITDFKTKRINQYTGGRIKDYQIEGYPKGGAIDNMLTNSFVSMNGEYIGDYAKGWYYFRNKLIVCEDYPHGVAIMLKSYLAEQRENDNIMGYVGYTHRGSCLFKLGDKLFNENTVAVIEKRIPKTKNTVNVLFET